MPQDPNNKISQTTLKYQNEFRNIRTEALRWVKMTTDTGIKIKVETSAKERNQQLLDSIIINILKLEQQHPSSQYKITLPINPVTSRYHSYPVMGLNLWYIYCS